MEAIYNTIRYVSIGYSSCHVSFRAVIWGINFFQRGLKYGMENHRFCSEMAYRCLGSGRASPRLSSLFPIPTPPPLPPLSLFPGSMRTNSLSQTNIKSHSAHTKSCNFLMLSDQIEWLMLTCQQFQLQNSRTAFAA